MSSTALVLCSLFHGAEAIVNVTIPFLHHITFERSHYDFPKQLSYIPFAFATWYGTDKVNKRQSKYAFQLDYASEYCTSSGGLEGALHFMAKYPVLPFLLGAHCSNAAVIVATVGAVKKITTFAGSGRTSVSQTTRRILCTTGWS